MDFRIRRKRARQAACFRSYHWETAEDEDDDEEDGEGSKERPFGPSPSGAIDRLKFCSTSRHYTSH
jgi:hypothetical protein